MEKEPLSWLGLVFEIVFKIKGKPSSHGLHGGAVFGLGNEDFPAGAVDMLYSNRQYFSSAHGCPQSNVDERLNDRAFVFGDGI